MSLPLMRDGRPVRAAVFAFSRRGLETAERVRAALTGPGDVCAVYAPERLSGEGSLPITPPLASFAGPVFREADALIFVGACGIISFCCLGC